MQNVVDGHDTESSVFDESMLCGVDQLVPFHLNALPELSTAMQNADEVQDTESTRPPFGSTSWPRPHFAPALAGTVRGVAADAWAGVRIIGAITARAAATTVASALGADRMDLTALSLWPGKISTSFLPELSMTPSAGSRSDDGARQRIQR